MAAPTGSVIQNRVFEWTFPNSYKVLLSQDGLNLNGLTLPRTSERTDITGQASSRFLLPTEIIDGALSFQVRYDVGAATNTDMFLVTTGQVHTWKHGAYGNADGDKKESGSAWLETVERVFVGEVLHLNITASLHGAMEISTWSGGA